MYRYIFGEGKKYFFLIIISFFLSSSSFFNQLTPIWDEANYIYNSQKIIEKLSLNPLDIISSFFLERHWRPISFPFFTSFFFIIKNDVLISIKIYHLISNFIFVLALNTLIKNYLNDNQSILLTALVASSSWIYNLSSLFMPEFLVLIMLMISFNFYIKDFKKNYFWVGIFLGFAVTLRPVEILIYILVPFIIFFYQLLTQKKKLDIFTFIIVGTFILISILYNYWFTNYIIINLFILACSILLLILIFFDKNLKLSAHSKILLVTLNVGFSWFIIFTKQLLSWALTTSFGNLAKTTDQVFLDLSIFKIIKSLLFFYSPKMISIILIISIIILLYNFIYKKIILKPRFLKLYIILTISTLILIFIYKLTGTSDYRRIFGLMFFFQIFMLIDIFKNLKNNKVFIFSLIFIFLLNLSSIINAISDKKLNITNKFKYDHYKKTDKSFDINKKIINEIIEEAQINMGNFAVYSFCYRNITGCADSKNYFVDHSALNTISQSLSLDYFFHSEPITNFEITNIEEFFIDLKKKYNYQYVLIDFFTPQEQEIKGTDDLHLKTVKKIIDSKENIKNKCLFTNKNIPRFCLIKL